MTLANPTHAAHAMTIGGPTETPSVMRVVVARSDNELDDPNALEPESTCEIRYTRPMPPPISTTHPTSARNDASDSDAEAVPSFAATTWAEPVYPKLCGGAALA